MYQESNKNELSLRAYNLTIGAILFSGFFINYLMCKYLSDIFVEWDTTLVIIGYFALALLGIFLSVKSHNPLVSFTGYNLVVVPVGVVLSICLKDYDNGSIMHAIIVTGTVTALMIALAMIYPKIFLSMGKVLLSVLCFVVITECILLLFGFSIPGIWDAGVAVLFALYVGYDWAKAQKEDHTYDNAVDACVDLYLDIINILLRILGSSSKSKSKD